MNKVDEFLLYYVDERSSVKIGKYVFEYKEVKELMKDLLILAADKAKTEKVGNSGSWLDAGIDKQSILNVLEDDE